MLAIIVEIYSPNSVLQCTVYTNLILTFVQLIIGAFGWITTGSRSPRPLVLVFGMTDCNAFKKYVLGSNFKATEKIIANNDLNIVLFIAQN